LNSILIIRSDLKKEEMKHPDLMQNSLNILWSIWEGSRV